VEPSSRIPPSWGLSLFSWQHLQRNAFRKQRRSETGEIGDASRIGGSVIGRNVLIGQNVEITNSYVWDDVIIEDNVTVDHAVVASNVKLRRGCCVQAGCVLASGVVVGEGFTVAAYSRLTTEPDLSRDKADLRNEEEENDELPSEHEESRFPDSDGVSSDMKTYQLPCTPADVGAGGIGRLFASAESDPHHLNSLAPNLKALPHRAAENENDSDLESEPEDIGVDDDDFKSPSMPVSAQLSNAETVSNVAEEVRLKLQQEVYATVRRGHLQKSSVEDIAVEVSGLKFSHDPPLMDYARAVLLALFNLIEPQPQPPDNSPGSTHSEITIDMKKSLLRLIKKWKSLLTKYGQAKAEQVRILQGLESACTSYERTFGPLFGTTIKFLYDEDVLLEDAILEWEAEPKTSASQQRLLSNAKFFLDWLREASEDEED